MSSEQHLFSEQEAAEILRRAVELNEQAADETEYQPGITREELERIAGEVGVSVQFLLQAIKEAGSFESRRGPLHLTEEVERVVDVELNPEDFDVVSSQLKPFSNAGQPAFAQIGRSLKGSAWTGISQAEVEISSRKGRTKIKVKSTPLLAFLLGILPAFIVGLISMAVFAENGHVAAGILSATGVAIAGLFAFRKLLQAGHKKARQLAERIKQIVVSESSKS
jgi:hypothetical protein